MDIHHRGQVLSWIVRKIEKEVPEPNRSLIFDFDHENLARGLGISTRVGYLSHLYKLAGLIGKPFNQTDSNDIAAVLQYIEGNGYSQFTREKFRRTLKRFWSWMGEGESTKNIRTMSRSELYKLSIPETILTRPESRRIIASGRNLYEKAVLAILAETGARIGEILALRTKSVEFDRIGAKLMLPHEGKTGKRSVRIIRCKCNHGNLAVNLLSKIIDYDHEFVFHKHNHLTGNDTAPSYQFVRHLFERVRAAKCTKKHVHAHLFRHTAATRISSWLSYTQLCDFFGWKYGSKMPSIYIRCNNVQLDNALLKGYGLKAVTPEKLCIWC